MIKDYALLNVLVEIQSITKQDTLVVITNAIPLGVKHSEVSDAQLLKYLKDYLTMLKSRSDNPTDIKRLV